MHLCTKAVALLLVVGCAVGYQLDGTFLSMAQFNVTTIPAYLDRVRALSMRTVVTWNTKTKAWGVVCPCKIFKRTASVDYLSVLLREAAARDMNVWIGLILTTTGTNCSTTVDPQMTINIDATSDILAEFNRTPGFLSHPALSGWYLPDEPNLSDNRPMSRYYNYYAGLVRAIRKWSKLPVMLSPYLTSVRAQTPKTMGDRAMWFAGNTSVDVQSWQDSVGAAGNSLRVSPTIGEYYRAMHSTIGAALWGNVEAFNYAKGPSSDSGGYRSTCITRYATQIAQLGPHVGKLLTWIHNDHMDVSRESPRLRDGYRAEVLHLPGELMFRPANVTLNGVSEPRLHNRISADPFKQTDSEWVLVPKSRDAKIQVRFLRPVIVKWVSLHVASFTVPATNGQNASLPLNLTVYLANLSMVGTWPSLAHDYGEGEYSIGNLEAMNVTCDSLVILLQKNRSDNMMLSELEVVGSLPPPPPAAESSSQLHPSEDKQRPTTTSASSTMRDTLALLCLLLLGALVSPHS